MKMPTLEEIKKAINETDDDGRSEILDTLLNYSYIQKNLTITRSVDGFIWHIECINPYQRIHFTND